MTRRSPPEEPEDDGGPMFGMFDALVHAQIRRAVAADRVLDSGDGHTMSEADLIPSTFRDRLAEHFKARPGLWINGLELAKLAGAYAWRSRVSDCRTQLGMRIENRQRKHENATISEYRWVP